MLLEGAEPAAAHGSPLLLLVAVVQPLLWALTLLWNLLLLLLLVVVFRRAAGLQEIHGTVRGGGRSAMRHTIVHPSPVL
jgi:hypothetical protein